MSDAAQPKIVTFESLTRRKQRIRYGLYILAAAWSVTLYLAAELIPAKFSLVGLIAVAGYLGACNLIVRSIAIDSVQWGYRIPKAHHLALSIGIGVPILLPIYFLQSRGVRRGLRACLLSAVYLVSLASIVLVVTSVTRRIIDVLQ